MEQRENIEYIKTDTSGKLHEGVIIDNRFRILKVIGGGGFSTVYKAWDLLMNSTVAVKEYFPAQYAERALDGIQVEVREGNNRTQFTKGLEQFSREAKQTAALGGKHNVVSVIAYAEGNGTAYMIMEYLKGMTLKEYQKTLPGGIFSDISEVVTIIAAIAEALSYCHRAKLLHRDVSADNIFLCSNGAMKLIDFGNAYPETEEEYSSIVIKEGCTPPEQYSSRGKQGPWTDLYALSAVCYRMLTGEYPDTAPDRQADGAPELISLRERNPKVPEFVDVLIMRCLDLDYRYRISDADEFLRILRSERIVDNSDEARKKHRLTEIIATICSVFFVVLLGAVLNVMWKNSQILEPCTLYVAVPDNISTAEGLAEAERLFEEKWDTVDLVFMPENNMTAVPAVYPSEIGDNTVPIAVDYTVLYINLLKADQSEIPNPVPEHLITESYAEFLASDNCYCVYRGHAYEYRKIEQEPQLMAQFQVREDTANQEFLISFRYDENLTTAETEAAQTFLRFFRSEAAQKALFLEECGMRPANTALLDDYYTVYNKLSQLSTRKGK